MNNILLEQIRELVSYGNHIEIVVLPSSNNTINKTETKTQYLTTTTNIDTDDFTRLLRNMKKINLHGFQRQFKEYTYRNLYYEHTHGDKTNIHLYKKEVRDINTSLSNQLYVMVSQRDKIAYHIFPSTNQIPSISYVSKATFKVNNRVFINFECKKYQEDCSDGDTPNVYNKIYINYNHDENVDIQKNVEQIEKALNALGVSFKE
jgi:uncharacterized protein YqgV (UPF0045/DUF77 family)